MKLQTFFLILLIFSSFNSFAEDLGISGDADTFLGNEDADITIIEFSDYQCPFCRRFYTETFPLLKENYIKKGEVKFVYRDFPLSFHPSAQIAAESTECAKEQGRFWEMHDKIFDEQNRLGQETVQFTKEDLKNWAIQIGLDSAKFNICIDSNKYKEAVEEDFSEGLSYGVQGTPTFFIIKENSDAFKRIDGSQPYNQFEQVLNEVMNLPSIIESDSSKFKFEIDEKVFTLKLLKESEELPLFIITLDDGFNSKVYIKEKVIDNVYKGIWSYHMKSYNIILNTNINKLTVEPRELPTEPTPIIEKAPNLQKCLGCENNNQCINFGFRIIDNRIASYCDLDKQIKLQKNNNEQCQNNYECLSNSCGNGVCQDINERIEGIEQELKEQKNLLQRILDFFSILFWEE
ncbi:MAG: DsbA family protein [Nanoarchaeota archaeon]